jgi:cell division septal protein FtsQ
MFKQQKKRPSYKNLARKRAAQSFKSKLNIKIPRVFKIGFGLFIAAVFVYLMITLPVFRISDIKTSKTYKISSSQIENELSEFLNRNIFTLSSTMIEEKLNKNVSGIKRVYTTKIFPNGLFVEIVEEYPAVILISQSGANLIDNTMDLLSTLENSPQLKLLDYEVDLLEGRGDFNAEYVRDFKLLQLSEEERKAFKWEELPEEEKRLVLSALENEISGKKSTYEQEIEARISDSSYADLPKVYSYIEDFEMESLKFALDASDQLISINLKVSEMRFISRYTLELVVEDTKRILLSTRRDLPLQLADLNNIIFYNQFSQAKIIDLRSDVYSITN